MQIAQKLYEGNELGASATSASSPTCVPTPSASATTRSPKCDDYIATKYGADILPEKPNVYRVKKAAQAQEAHEAIRPTSLEFDPETIKDT